MAAGLLVSYGGGGFVADGLLVSYGGGGFMWLMDCWCHTGVGGLCG